MKQFVFLLSVAFLLPLQALDLVIPDQPHEYEKLAATELKEALLLGGYKDPVEIKSKKDAVSPAIFFGKAFAVGQLPQKPESWSIRNRNKDLVIAGNTPIGTLYGCYALLRNLGVWYIAWDETVIPDLSKFRIPTVATEGAPAFMGRQMFNRYPNIFRDFRAKGSDAKFWRYYLRNLFKIGRAHV